MLFSTVVYDFNSNSGALLPSVTYRFTENLSASIGVNVFFGHQQLRDAPINEIRPGLNRVGHDAYKDAVENGLTALRERDEMNLNIRYTF
jgi:phosphopantothenate synthetase